jgi:hypothetical protein
MAARAIAVKLRINESGIEQTVVAFDVTLEMPTSQQGAAAFCAHQPEGQALPAGRELGCSKRPRRRVASLRGFSFANGSTGLFPSPALSEHSPCAPRPFCSHPAASLLSGVAALSGCWPVQGATRHEENIEA